MNSHFEHFRLRRNAALILAGAFSVLSVISLLAGSF